MTSSESISLGVCAILVTVLLLSTGYVLGIASTVHQEKGSICIERELYCPEYSDMHHPCERTKCTIPDDAVITNKKYSLTGESLDRIKDDAYTRGIIDGRASIFEEQSTTGYKHEDLGVQEGYEPSPYPQWREYANCIARNICPHKEQPQQPDIMIFDEMNCSGGYYRFAVGNGILEVCDYPKGGIP